MASNSTLNKLAARANAAPAPASRVIEIPLEKIRFDPSQPRKIFHTLDQQVPKEAQEYIDELAASIEVNGLIEPITVEEMLDGTYRVLVGECRTRAHMQLDLKTIRSVVKSSFESPQARLLFQIAENVNRKGLSDQELAEVIRVLLEGGDGIPPMKQKAIGIALGKSESWVSRFARYLDEELQRVWVKTGIVETVETLYRVTLLPKQMQVELLRRVDLPETDPEWLAKPLPWSVVDGLSKEAKKERKSHMPPASFQMTGLGSNEISSGSVLVSPAASPAAPTLSSAQAEDMRRDVIQQALQAGSETEVNDKSANNQDTAGAPTLGSQPSEAEHNDTGVEIEPSMGASLSAGYDGYQLSAQDCAKIVGHSSNPVDQNQTGLDEAEDIYRPPVNCIVMLGSLELLLDKVKSLPDQELVELLRSVRVDLRLPAELAQSLGNTLSGHVVNEIELPHLIQTELAKFK